MAYFSTEGAGSQEENEFFEKRNVANQAFREKINTPEGMAAYQKEVNDRWGDIQAGRNGYAGNNDGDWFFDNFMESVMDNVIKYGPAVYAAAVGAEGLGLIGGAGAGTASGAGAGLATAGSAGADVALGGLSTSGLGLESLGWMNGLSSAGGLGAAEAAGVGGLGSMIASGSTPAVVNVTAPSLATGGGLGTGLAGAGAAAGGVVGLDNILGDNPQLPVDRAALEDMGQINGSTGSTTPPASGVPSGGGIPDGNGDVSLGGGGPAGVPSGGGNLPGTIGGILDNIPGGIGGIIGGIGDIIGANSDRIINRQDMEYWQGMMDKLLGMYAPGSPEAEMMRHKMEAQDAAAGRNSQYGIREQNLAAILADQKSKIMTNPTFYKMGEAARGHYDDSLNSLKNLFGQATSGSGNGLGSLFGIGSSVLGGLGGLSGLFGGNNMFSSGSYV